MNAWAGCSECHCQQAETYNAVSAIRSTFADQVCQVNHQAMAAVHIEGCVSLCSLLSALPLKGLPEMMRRISPLLEKVGVASNLVQL